MQGQLTKPTDPEHIAYPGTPHEVWWDARSGDWVKPPTSAGPGLDQLVQVYTAIRDARSVKKRAFEEEDLSLEEDMRKLRVVMLELLNRTGAKSIATDHGTVYRSEKLKPSAADWNAIYGWIAENPERFEILEKRLKSTFVKDYMEEHGGIPPPGVNTHREYEVSVRRANSTPG